MKVQIFTLSNFSVWNKKLYFKLCDIERKFDAFAKMESGSGVKVSTPSNKTIVKSLPHTDLNAFKEWALEIKKDQANYFDLVIS